ncbi:unnamed protein product [Paramecium pentaurelia]|uniref:Aurora kinase n=1 Tax=Paramecium pentaurelia TaxID=43138 RepID=A0A8S1SKV7_9CILI|nr:unnamed protein product [Paramecium pentaurelia]
MSQPVLNKVRERLFFLSPTVQAGWEPESKREDFEELKILGQGAFGVVKKVTHKKTNIVYAIKIVEKAMLKKTNMVEQMQNEVKIMYSLNHPYILKLYNHFEDDINVYLILEFVGGGQLYAVLWRQPQKKFDEKTSAKFILQACLALENIHSKNIVHRDIKPENLLLDEKQDIKLADFGWSNFLKPNEIRQTFCGTLDYLAPEMLEKSRQHDHQIDIWAIGVLCFELLTGLSPFAPQININNQTFVEKTTKDNIINLRFQFPTSFPPLAQDLIKMILVKEPGKRSTCQQIKEHQWIVQNTQHVKIPASLTVQQEKKIIQNPEIESLQKDGKLVFTNDQIYSFSRPDSIIVKDFLQGDNTNNKLVEALNKKMKEKDSKIQALEIENQKKQQEINEHLSTIDLMKKSGQASQEIQSMQHKLKLQDERYAFMKQQYEQQLQKNIELEKKIRELESQSNQIEQMKSKMNKYKEEAEIFKTRAKKAEEQVQQMVISGINEKEFQEVPKQQEQVSNVDDLLKKLQNKYDTKS